MSVCATAPRMPISIVASAAHISTSSKRAAGEQQRLGADDRVDADLGEQAGEHRGDRRRRGRVAVGQPGREREHRGLDAERDQQHRLDQQLRAGRQLAQPPGQLRHVDRAGRGVDQGDGGEEDQRAEQADHDVGDAGADAGRRAAEGQQHVARRQQDLEADVEVEQVAGEERVGHAGDQHQERRVEDRQRRLLVAVGGALADGEHEHAERDGGRDDEHQRREPVDDEHDARAGPASRRRRARRRRRRRRGAAGRPTTASTALEHEDAQRPLHPRVPAADQQRGRGTEQRQQHRQRGQDADHGASLRVLGRSTSSDGMPGRRRASSASTSSPAVQAVGVTGDRGPPGGGRRGRARRRRCPTGGRPGGPPRRRRRPPAGPAARSGR